MSVIKQSGQLNIQGLPEHIFNNDDLIDLPVQGSKIVEFFDGKSVFITGATGFLGRLLVEKLLRTCRGIETIFILIREKKNQDVKTRAKKLFDDVVFSKLQKEYPSFRNKIRIVQGDITLPNLGINDEDKKNIIEKIHLIFHGAATVLFDEPLKKALEVNVRGTKYIIDLSKQCKQLEALIYISTAFSHCHNKHIQEILYESPMTTERALELINKWSETDLEILTNKICQQWPNTYSFSKAIAEDTIREFATELPVCLFRPSVVVATYKEPLQSWSDNLYGATGIVVGSGTGVLKTLYCDGNKVLDIVPADFVCNALIAASQKTATQKKNQIDIYNYVSGTENPITYDQFLDYTQKYGTEYPTIQCIWYFCLTLNKNKYINFIYIIFLHYIPALIMDGVSIITGRKPVMLKLYKKVQKFSSVLSYFTMNDWKFDNTNAQNLWNELSNADKYLFKFSMKELDWDEFSQTHAMGLRTYIIKEDPSTLLAARVRWHRFMKLHMAFKIFIRILGLYFIYLILSKLYSYVF